MAVEARYADIKTGFSCNNNCVHCVIADKRRLLKKEGRETDRNTREILEQMQQARKDGISKLVLTGGEITIRDDFFEILKQARQLGFRVGIQTNGRMFCYDEFARKVAQTCSAKYTVALNGPKPEIHDKISRCEGAFKQTVQGIKNLIAQNQVVYGKIVISRYNLRYLAELVELFHQLGARSVNIAFPHAQGNAELYFEQVVPTYTELKPQLDKVIATSKRWGIWVVFEAVPLCFLGGEEIRASEIRMGASQLRDLVGINPEYQETRKNIAKIKAPQCANCKYDNICEGPWIEYPERRGFDEFNPVPGDKLTEIPPEWLDVSDTGPNQNDTSDKEIHTEKSIHSEH